MNNEILDLYEIKFIIEDEILCELDNDMGFDDMDFGETAGFYGCTDENILTIINCLNDRLNIDLSVLKWNSTSHTISEVIETIYKIYTKNKIK